MTNFVRDNTALPFPKFAWDGVSDEVAQPGQWCRPADWAAVCQAAVDLRGWVQTGLAAGTYPLATLIVDADGRITGVAAGASLAAIATSGSASDLSAGTVPAARMPALTGPVTTSAGGVATAITASAVGTTELASAAVTNAKLANMAASTIKGSIAGGVPADLSSAQTTALLDLFTSVLRGLVPASGGGTTNFLRADGTWASAGGAPSGLGTGHDGAAAFDGSTAVPGWTLAGSTYTQTRPTMFTSITVSVGVTCKPAGWPTYSQGPCINNGTWFASGGSASGNAGGTAAWASGVMFPGGQNGPNAGSDGGNSSSAAPQDFVATAGAARGVGGVSPTAGAAGTAGGGGGGGGATNAAGGTSGGAGGPVVLAALANGWWAEERCARTARNNLAAALTVGSPGGAGANGSSGGGGGSPGGWCYLAALSFSGSGTYEARGGNGGVAISSGSGSGGGGGGGVFIFRCGQGTPPTANVSGGNGGAANGGGAGGNGGAGLSVVI